MADRLGARAMRKGLPEADRAAWSEAIANAIRGWDCYRQAQTVMAYVAFAAEVETATLLEDILQSGKRLVLPRCEAGGIMHGHAVASLGALQPGIWGILEPVPETPIIPREAIDLILVPGLLFDRDGNRLGQGAGYYDRYLAGYEGMTCALAYEAQLVARLPVKPHDVPMRMICTQEGFIKGKSEA